MMRKREDVSPNETQTPVTLASGTVAGRGAWPAGSHDIAPDAVPELHDVAMKARLSGLIWEIEQIATDLVSGHPSMARNGAANIRLQRVAQAMKDAIG